MSVWHGAQARRRTAVALAAVALTVSLTACGGTDDDGKSGADPSSSAPAAEKSKGEDQGKDDGPTVPDTSKTLATINGSNGLQLVIHTAARDDGGFLTVTGTIKNTSSSGQSVPIQWNGSETQVRQTGRSLMRHDSGRQSGEEALLRPARHRWVSADHHRNQSGGREGKRVLLRSVPGSSVIHVPGGPPATADAHRHD